ncbi:MAG TPA: glycosyltransferase, partial [Gammaproteobacteria bacterium]
MKILLAHNYYRSTAPSGEDAVFRNEKQLLQNHGFDVITYEKFNDELADSTLLHKLKVARNYVWSWQAYSELTELLEKERPDVAHFHNTFPQISPSGYDACVKYRVPVIQTLHNFRFICPGAMLLRDEKPCELCLENTLLSAVRYRCYRDSLTATLPHVLN